MERLPPRMLIHTRDIENITGLRERTARSLAMKIKKYFKKDSKGFLTVEEFCSYMQLDETMVRRYLWD